MAGKAAPKAEGSVRGGKTMTKADAVRAALAEGVETSKEGVEFIKDRFGIEIAPMHFAAQKSQIKKKEQGEDQGTRKAPKPRQATDGDQGDLLAAMEAIKPLVASLGAEKVKRIVDLLG